MILIVVGNRCVDHISSWGLVPGATGDPVRKVMPAQDRSLNRFLKERYATVDDRLDRVYRAPRKLLLLT